MSGTCAQCDESNVVVNAAKNKKYIVVQKRIVCFSQKDESVQNMQSHKSKASTGAAVKVRWRGAFGAKLKTAANISI